MPSQEVRALIYLRVSTDRQAQKGIALPTQEGRCLEHAHESGYLVDQKTDVYIDGGETGKNMERPALMDLLARCKEDKRVRAVIVYDVSRLARNRLDFALIKQSLRKAGVTLVSATEPIDESPEGQMLEGVLSTVAEFFSAQTARKVKANMRRKAEAGGWPAHAPYGYRNRREKLPTGEVRAWIEPDPEEAQWVRRAFELFGSGSYSVKRLTQRINKEGAVVRKQKNRATRRFHHSHLERILRKKIYVGIVEWDGATAHGTHETLIDAGLFYRVQDLLLLRSGSTARLRRYRSLFKGIAKCGECGSAMTIDVKEVSSARTVRYWRCRKISRGRSGKCKQRYYLETEYIRQLGLLMERIKLPAHSASYLRETLAKLSTQEQQVHERGREGLERKLGHVRERKKNLLLRSLDDDFQGPEQRSLYESVRAELEREERKVKSDLDRLSLRFDNISRVLTMALEIAECCESAFAAEEDPDYRGLLARVIFKELRMRDGTISEATLNTPLVFLRRWAGEKSCLSLVDLGPLGEPSGALVDGQHERRNRQVSLARIIRSDLLKLQDLLTAGQEADIEGCYRELRGRQIIGAENRDNGPEC